MQYLIAKEQTSQLLANTVQELIDKGWKPQGGITTLYNQKTDQLMIYQAMIKE